jgi:hypothetical protein
MTRTTKGSGQPSSDRFHPRVDPWSLDARDYPDAGFEMQIGFLLRYALLAPSYRNAQPWRFAVQGNEVLVCRDPTRRIPVADPTDRDLLLGIGAALTNLRVAAARFGLASEVHAAEGSDDLVARVHLSAGRPIERGLSELFPALTARRTDRGEMRGAALTDAQRRILARSTSSGAARLRLFTIDPPKVALARLVYESTVERMADRRYRDELADWLRPADGVEVDGIGSDQACLTTGGFRTAAWSTRNFNTGETVGLRLAAQARTNAALVLAFSGDDAPSLLDAGQLMERFVLAATSLGMRCSFFSLPPRACLVPGEILDPVSADGVPQVLFRVGYPEAHACRPTSRRPLRDVLVT